MLQRKLLLYFIWCCMKGIWIKCHLFMYECYKLWYNNFITGLKCFILTLDWNILTFIG